MAAADDDLVAGRVYKPVGYAQHTNLSAVLNLDAIPASGKRLAQTKGKPIRALIQAEGQDVRWTDDPDVNPTAAVGNLLKANTTLAYEGDLSKFHCIEAAAGAKLNVNFYGV